MLLDLLQSLGPWNWVFAGLVLMALETVIPGVHFLWFGLAAAIVGAISLLAAAAGHPEVLTLPLQLVLFAAVSVVMVLWVRSVTRGRSAPTDEPTLNDRGSQLIGRIVIVETAIESGRGRVRVGDTLWSAEAPADAPAGAHVRILGSKGSVLTVERA